jgi:nucleolar complex protein 3
MHKPVRAEVGDDLPSLESDDDEDNGEEWTPGLESLGEEDEDALSDQDEEEEDDVSVSSSDARPRKEKHLESDDKEMPYETAPRKRRPSWEPESTKDRGIERLPIKLADGRVLKSRAKVYLPQDEEEESADESDMPFPMEEKSRIEDVSTGARFGRPAVVDVVSQKSRKARIQAAKEQIAGICQEIVADPENSVRAVVRATVLSTNGAISWVFSGVFTHSL